MRRLTILSVICACLFAALPQARAEDTFGREASSERAPSMLSYGFRGLGAGALVGVSGGYLAARSGDFDGDSDWRKVGLGTGIGALAGMGLGLGLGALDLSADRPGVGGIVLRDMLYGTGLGAVAGVIGGGISALAQDDAEHLAFGTALGAVSGAGVGLIVGLIEGPRIVRSRRHQAYRLAPTVAAMRDSNNQNVMMWGASGHF